MYGIGCSGSMWIRLRATGGTWANVSTSGASPRSGASTAAASATPPATAPSITTIERPRTNSGSSGSGGTCRMRADVVTSSGTVRVHSTHAASTSRARSAGHSSMPA